MRILAVSGFVDNAHQELCRQAGFDGFLAKPMNLAALEAMLNRERAGLPTAYRAGYTTAFPAWAIATVAAPVPPLLI
jgi:CheY-like chemotaxis protein